MHRYETLFVLLPDLPEAQVRETMDRVRRLIEGMQGQVLEIQDWGVRELAYRIRKQVRGTYVLVQYESKPDVLKELERTLKIADEVLRFVSVRMPDAKKLARRGPRRPPVPTEEPVQAATPEQGS